MPRHGSVPASLDREERLESGRSCRQILYSALLEQAREFKNVGFGEGKNKRG